MERSDPRLSKNVLIWAVALDRNLCLQHPNATNDLSAHLCCLLLMARVAGMTIMIA